MTRHRFLIATLVLLFPCLLLAADLPKAPGLTDLVKQYESPKLGPFVTIQNPVTIKVAHMTFELKSGSAAPVLGGDSAIGLFFSGDGSYVYESDDPIEQKVVLWEAKRLDHSAHVDRGKVFVEGRFERLYLLASGVDLPRLQGSTFSATLNGELNRLVAHYAQVFPRYMLAPPPRWTPAAHLLIRQRIDQPDKPVAVAEMEGHGDTAYVLDTIERKVEELDSIQHLWTPTDYDQLRASQYAVPISRQPVGWKHGEFVQPRYLLADVDYQLVNDDGDSMKLSMTETVVPREAPLRVLRFNLESGVWRTDTKYREVHVDSVKTASGRSLAYDFDQDSLLVEMPQKIDVGQPAVIHFEISGDVLYHPYGDNYWQQGTEPWFPQPDLNGQYFTLHSVVKVRKPWIAFAPGKTISRHEEGDYNVVENRVDKPVQFAVVHAGKYATHESTEDGLTIQVAAYAQVKPEAMEKLGKLARGIIKFYEPWLGPFPFHEFKIIEINDLGWGQAPPGVMFITKEAFNPLISGGTRAYSLGVNQRFAHEIAHQYWGMVVKMGSWEEQWVTESFAEYCSSWVEKQIKGKRGWANQLTEWRQGAKDGGDYAPIPLANRVISPADPLFAPKVRTGLLYGKGPLLLAALHEQLGDKKFYLLLRNLQGLYAWRFLTTDNIAALAKRIDDGKDYAPFFDRYFWGTDIPKVRD